MARLSSKLYPHKRQTFILGSKTKAWSLPKISHAIRSSSEDLIQLGLSIAWPGAHLLLLTPGKLTNLRPRQEDGQNSYPFNERTSFSEALPVQLLADSHEAWSMSASSLNSGNVILNFLSFYISVFWVLAQSLRGLSQTPWTFLFFL